MISRLDYCNGLLVGLPKVLLDQLNGVMRAAARLVLQLPRNSHIRSDMKNKLHWLDFPARSIFKLCVIAYRCQRGQAPTYLSELIITVSTIPGRTHLRSATTGLLLEPACRTVTLGPRAFSSSCPAAWNYLPADLRTTDVSLPMFRNQVKTFLFNLV